MSDTPLVSVVTPSLNQGDYLEETMISVFEQTYPRVEYLVIDGQSQDASQGIIEKYKSRLAMWRSEPDEGQAHAINKGLRAAGGDILAWLNADDRYHPGTVARAVEAFTSGPRLGMVHGHHAFIDEGGRTIGTSLEDHKRANFDMECLLNTRDFINQPTVFMRRDVLDTAGLLRRDLKYAMDYDLWIRIGRVSQIGFVDSIQADYRLHKKSKTTLMPFELAIEKYKTSRTHGGNGVGIALRVLLLRWRHIVHQTASLGPGGLREDIRSPGFEGLPRDVRVASKGTVFELLLEGAYVCMNSSSPLAALPWLFEAARLSPSRVVTRGTIANFAKSVHNSFRSSAKLGEVV